MDEQKLGTYLDEMRSLVRRTESLSARTLRRQRLLPGLRQFVVEEHARRQRLRLWRRIEIGTLSIGAAAAIFAVAIRPMIKTETAVISPTLSVAEVGVAVTKGTVIVSQLSGRRELAAGQDVDVTADDSIETTPTDEAQVRLASIANVVLRRETRLIDIGTRAGQVEHIRLAKGSVHLKVTKLAADRRFHVVTPDADVQVRGTEFDVNLIAEPTPHTCVRVQEGLVQVTTGADARLVAAGETWGCESGTQKPAAAVINHAPARPERRAPTAASIASDLRIQNELFQRALSDERAGHFEAASSVYNALLHRYPTGPLAAQAQANLAAMPHDR
jgi:hypothetical protein